MTKPRVVASIEARMKSQRFPGKVLMDIEGTTSLSRLLKRLRRANLLDEIVLATSHTIATLHAIFYDKNLTFHIKKKQATPVITLGTHYFWPRVPLR